MRPSKEGLTLAGSIGAALAASACCIGPAVLVALGLGGAGFAVALEPFRPLFIALTLALLGSAFYFVYRPAKAEACDAQGSCRASSRRRGLKALLWAATLIVLAALAFPYYVGYLFGIREAPAATADPAVAPGARGPDAPGGALARTEEGRPAERDPAPDRARAVIPVEGMTCGGCETAVELALRRLDGIVTADADHENGTATVTYAKDRVTVERILEEIRKAGFSASLPEARPEP